MTEHDGGCDWRPVLAFDTQDPEFARGAEAGILWQRLEQEDRVTAAISDRNAEMVIRIAEARGLPFTAEPLGEGWLTVTIGHPLRVPDPGC